jgi:hypothetical protein
MFAFGGRAGEHLTYRGYDLEIAKDPMGGVWVYTQADQTCPCLPTVISWCPSHGRTTSLCCSQANRHLIVPTRSRTVLISVKACTHISSLRTGAEMSKGPVRCLLLTLSGPQRPLTQKSRRQLDLAASRDFGSQFIGRTLLWPVQTLRRPDRRKKATMVTSSVPGRAEAALE